MQVQQLLVNHVYAVLNILFGLDSPIHLVEEVVNLLYSVAIPGLLHSIFSNQGII